MGFSVKAGTNEVFCVKVNKEIYYYTPRVLPVLLCNFSIEESSLLFTGKQKTEIRLRACAQSDFRFQRSTVSVWLNFSYCSASVIVKLGSINNHERLPCIFCALCYLYCLSSLLIGGKAYFMLKFWHLKLS